MAAAATNELLISGWKSLRIARTFSLEDIAGAHEYANAGPRGRVVLTI